MCLDKGMCLGKGLKFGLLLVAAFFSSFTNAQAQTKHIWCIGKLNIEDFLPQSKEVIDYMAPPNWPELLGQDDPNWGEFPLELYAEAAGEGKPQEVRINFDYPEDYGNPTLCIDARIKSPVSSNPSHCLVLYKGEKDEIGRMPMSTTSLCLYTFPTGYLKKGLDDRNRLIIKVESATEIPIIFLTLWLSLDEKDQDNDGVSDADEGEAYRSISSTVSIPIKSYDPKDIERITLHIEGSEESEGSSPCFREAGFLDPNSFTLPEQIASHYYFPYGFLGFRIEEVDPQGEVRLKISYPDPLYPSATFYTFQESGEWPKINFEMAEAQSVSILLADGGAGDFDGQKDGAIHTRLFLAHPQGLGLKVEKSGCFIEQIMWGKRE